MDVQYLKENVAGVLTKALVQVAIEQPEDAVDFVGNYLLKYVEKQERDQKLKELIAEEDELIKSLEARKLKAMEEEDAKQKLNQEMQTEEESMKQLLFSLTNEQEMYEQVLKLVKKRTGASSTYIGEMMKVPDEPESQALVWISASEDNQFLVGKTLVNEGVTFDLFKEVEDQTAKPNEDGTRPMILPSHIQIPNVMREPRMKFYRFPRLGAYLTVPISYNSFLQPEAFDTPAESQPDKDPNAPPGQAVRRNLVLALDSMGQARDFTTEEVSFVKKWSTFLSQALERADTAAFMDESTRRAEQLAKQQALASDLALKKATIEEEDQKAMEAAGELSDVAKQLLQAQNKLNQAKAMLQAIISSDCMEPFLSRVPPKDPVPKIMDCTAQLLQKAQPSLYCPISHKPKHESLRSLFQAEQLFSAMAQLSEPLPGTMNAAFLESLKAKMDEVDLAAATGAIPLSPFIHEWNLAVVGLVEALMAKKAAEEEEAAAAAAAAEAKESEAEE